MPALEVESQLALATLLMSYTHNTQDARQRLERAVSPCLLTSYESNSITMLCKPGDTARCGLLNLQAGISMS